MKKIMLSVLISILPLVCHADKFDEPSPEQGKVEKKFTKDDSKTLVGIISLALIVPSVIGAVSAKYGNGEGLFIAIGCAGAINGGICLIKF